MHKNTISFAIQFYRVLHIYSPAFDDSPFLSQLTLEKVWHLICKACTVALKSSCEKGGKGAFKNYVDRRGWVGGQSNVYESK